MNRAKIADFAATGDWNGLLNVPASVKNAGSPDLSNVTWSGVSKGYVYWNGSRFVPSSISVPPAGTTFTIQDQPGTAVRRRPPGYPGSAFENVFARYVHNVKEYGAAGDGGTDDLQAFNSAIYAINSAGGGALYIPASAYYLTAALDLLQVPCVIYGDGIGVTRLICNGNNCLSLYGDNSFTVAALSMENAVSGVLCEGGALYVNDIAVEATSRCLDLLNVTKGRISGIYGVSAGTGAVGVYGSANQLSIDAISLLGVGTSWSYGLYLTSGTGLIIDGVYANGVTNNAIYAGTGVRYSRITNITAANVLGSSVVNDLGTGNYVNEIHGIGGNTDTRYDSRKELFKKLSFAPGGIQPGWGFYDSFTLEGAALGDQAVLGVPSSLPPGVFTEARTNGIDSAFIGLINIGTSVVFIGTSTWGLRVFN